eukprot:gnl/TRDRNA2_/TRDRNA2_155372_c0_seq3.p1 gnl/TRDRNA2_/TRDRNA2_155372_c0~~gnl/TRDRNA2_/TRDRNA2_155372_c0_seq3.p1  ORF type:complete len:189 (-),score=36.89 gnl/TRDRNA2_/TRDRNA2_155372_c0_seq3:321-887(-)
MRHLLFVNFCFVSVRRKLAQDGHQKDGEVWTAVPDDSTVYRKSDDDEASRIRRMHREEIRRITEAGNYTLWEQLARQHRIDANKAPDGLDFDDEFANAQEGTVSDLEEESAAAAQNMTAEERIAWEADWEEGASDWAQAAESVQKSNTGTSAENLALSARAASNGADELAERAEQEQLKELSAAFRDY